MKQYEAVIETLKRLGGCATFGQLNQEVFKIEDCTWNTKTPFASIRRIVQDRKEIFRIRPGLWALEEYRSLLADRGIVAQDATNSDSEQVHEFNHSYYQGLLLYIGNMKKLETYVPAQDKNRSCLLYTSPSPRDERRYLVCRLLLEKKIFLMIRRPPRSTPYNHRRQRQMCIRDRSTAIRTGQELSLIHISEPTRRATISRMPSSA